MQQTGISQTLKHLYKDLGASRQGQPDPTAALHSKEYLQTPLSSRIQLTGAEKTW